jgi:branched-chain amino acid transport system permease protein
VITLQFFINLFAYFSIILLFAVAFFFQYRMFRFFDLSLGVTFLAGAYALVENTQTTHPLLFSTLLSIALGGGVGYGLLRLLIFPLVRRQASPLDLTLCALGVYIIGLNLIALMFGDELQIAIHLGISKPIELGEAIISSPQLGSIILAFLTLAIVDFTLRHTSAGRIFRALSDSPTLARDIGLPTKHVVVLAAIFGAIVTALTGLLVAADVGVRPTTAFPFIIPGLAAVLAFGAYDLRQVILGAAIVSVTGELAGLLFGQQWREFSIFAIVALMLAARMRFSAVTRHG